MLLLFVAGRHSSAYGICLLFALHDVPLSSLVSQRIMEVRLSAVVVVVETGSQAVLELTLYSLLALNS